MLGFVTAWALFSGLYLVFAGQASGDELVAAAGCGLAGAFWAAAVARRSRVRFRWSRPALAALARGAARLPLGAAEVAGALVRAGAGRVRGRVVEAPIVRGPERGCPDAARRAAAVLGRSLAPDSFVVRTTAGGDRLRRHILKRADR